MKLKIKILIAVWGNTYIKNFCELSLPSLMAAGNIPTLSHESELEVLIMTQKNDFLVFRKFPAFQRLQEQVPVRFVPIDDLTSGNVYGVTLTLAYARPILELKEKMLEYHFVFMNADFLLANGSLATLARVLRNGANVVLAPSLRIIAEKTEPLFRKRVDRKKGLLEIPPREFLKLGMPHLHPTTMGKIVNFKNYHTMHPNQLFWRADEDTLLGRYFLIFMLAIRPQSVVRDISSWCDYGFVPELCPQTPATVLGDSDEFLMIETQEKIKEKNYLRIGPLTPKGIKKSLDEWLTPGHLQNFQHEIIFHTKDLPNKIAKVRNDFNSFIENISLKNVRLQSHRNHFYWKSGLEAWLKNRAIIGIFNRPNELKGKLRIIEVIQLFYSKLLFQVNKNKDYSWSPEEPIMEPRLALLEKDLRRKKVFSKFNYIVTDHRNIIQVLCLLRRKYQDELSTARVICLSGNQKADFKIITSINNKKPICLILEHINRNILLAVTKNNLKCRLFILPSNKSQVDSLQIELLSAIIEQNSKIEVKVKSDKSFWLLKKLENLLKSVCINHKNTSILHLKKLLFGYPSEAGKLLQKWKVCIPDQLLCEILQSVNKINNKSKIWRVLFMNAGLCKVHLTIPYIDEAIHIPRIKFPLIYRLYQICYRMFHENNFIDSVRLKKPSGVLFSKDAFLIAIKLKPLKSFFN